MGLFALCALIMVVSGVRSYRGIGETSRLTSQRRASLGYVSGKLRASGGALSVSIRDEAGVRLLVIRDEVDGAAYETRVYYADGALREQFCEADLAFDPADGEEVAALPGFSFDRQGNLITLSALLSDGSTAETCVALRAL